jgi:hypothetical protein
MAMQDRRKYPRIREEDSVVVVVLSAPAAHDIENKTFFCSTEDISFDGLRFRIHKGVPAGAILQLLVAVMDPPRAYKHVGQVVWCREVPENSHYAIGVKFTGTPVDILGAWQDMVRIRLAENAG